MMGSKTSAKGDQMSKLLDLMSNPDKAKAQLSELTTAIEFHQRVSREADAKKEQAREAMETLDRRAAAISEDLAIREAEVADREVTIADRENKITARLAQLAAEEQRIEAAKAAHQAQVESLKSQIDSYKANAEENLLIARTKQEAELAAIREGLDTRIKDLNLKEEDLKKQIEAAQKKKIELQTREAIILSLEDDILGCVKQADNVLKEVFAGAYRDLSNGRS